MRLKCKPYKNEPVNYAQEKLDGHYLRIEKLLTGSIVALTSQDTDITKQIAACNPRWWKELLQRMPTGAVIEGELYVKGQRASAVKTALAQSSRIEFSAFAVPTLDHDLDLATIENECALMGIDFAAWHEIRHDETIDSLLAQAESNNSEGWVLKQAHYVGWYKLKRVRTIDLIVHAIQPGMGKFHGLCGALVCKTIEGHTVANVSGMTDTEREEISTRDIGRVVEVAYQYVGTRGKLRHPRFVRWRDDKQTYECHVQQDPELEAHYG